MQWTAQIYRTWGDNLIEHAEHLPWEQAEKIRRQARTQYHRLGDCYTELARELYTSREYPAVLWEGAEAYRTAHDFQSSAALLRLYMRNESRLRRAQALVDLGEAELSLGHLPSALEAFQDCIQQHPRDVAVYRARLLASRAAASMGDAKQAESFLADNLNGDQLTPASKEWRDSLFALGEFLHDAARDREAIPRLDEALHRYPAAPQATLARYLLGDSSRRRAKELRIAAAKEISSVVRAEQLSESRLLLHHALDAYRILQNTLGRRTREDLILQDQALLRNARFAIGETYLELELYPRRCGPISRRRTNTRPARRCSTPTCRSPMSTGGWTGRWRPAHRWNRPAWPCDGSRRGPVSSKPPTTTASNGAICWIASAACDRR